MAERTILDRWCTSGLPPVDSFNHAVDAANANYRRAEKAETEVERLKAELAKLRDWRATVTCALQREGGTLYADVPTHIRGLVAANKQSGWQPIESAAHLKIPYMHGLTPKIILGFAVDEEGYAPQSREGVWSPVLKRWVSTSDPCWGDGPQPTHWIPLPPAPTQEPTS